MLVNVFGESPHLVIDVMLGFCKSFTKGSLLSLQTVYLHYFNLKLLLLQQPALGNVIKDINGGGHRVTLLVRGPAKKIFFYKVRWSQYSCVSGATATSLMVPKIYLLGQVLWLHL